MSIIFELFEKFNNLSKEKQEEILKANKITIDKDTLSYSDDELNKMSKYFDKTKNYYEV